MLYAVQSVGHFARLLDAGFRELGMEFLLEAWRRWESDEGGKPQRFFTTDDTDGHGLIRNRPRRRSHPRIHFNAKGAKINQPLSVNPPDSAQARNPFAQRLCRYCHICQFFVLMRDIIVAKRVDARHKFIIVV